MNVPKAYLEIFGYSSNMSARQGIRFFKKFILVHIGILSILLFIIGVTR